MPEIEIRPANAADIPSLILLDHHYASEYVWQMDLHNEEALVQVSFREVRLPRSVQVKYPRDPHGLAEDWIKQAAILVAVLEAELIGYAGLAQNMAPNTTWVTDLVVARRLRRQGVGTALVLAAQEWASAHKSRRLILEMQPKNHPAIRLAQKLGFELCGYNDHYFTNHDIALFFSKWLR
jgi:GNAT superfamily N-acetyltransferase